MVDRIIKVESDIPRVESKEDTADEHENKSEQDQSDEKENDKFEPKLDFNKWTGEKGSTSKTHKSLWGQKPSDHDIEEKTNEGTSSTKEEEKEEDEEELTNSTSITFLKAAGMLNKNGTLQWGTITLYAFALIGFLIAMTIIFNALL